MESNIAMPGFFERPVMSRISRIAPFAVFMCFIAFGPLITALIAGLGYDTRWIYALRTIAVIAVLWAFRKQYGELHNRCGITRNALLLAVGSGFAVFAVWIHLDFGWATFGDAPVFDPSAASGPGIDWVLAVFRITGLALVVPVMEELFWRSFLQRWIDGREFLAVDPRKASMRAIVICAALFALEHNLWLAGLIAGLVYSLIYVRTANLWLPIISHAVTNGTLGIWILATGNWKFW